VVRIARGGADDVWRWGVRPERFHRSQEPGGHRKVLVAGAAHGPFANFIDDAGRRGDTRTPLGRAVDGSTSTHGTEGS
jgi:hypothetical protein